MNPQELMDAIAAANPKALAGISEKQALALIRATFASINRALEASSEGVVAVKGFGRFRTRSIEREVKGSKVTRRVIRFAPAKPKEKGATGKRVRDRTPPA